MSLQLWGPAGRRAGFQTGLAFAPEGLHPAHYGTYGGLNDPGHSLVGMAPLQERHRFGAPRFQLSGSAFGSHEPYYATARTIYPLFMRGSISVQTKKLARSKMSPQTASEAGTALEMSTRQL